MKVAILTITAGANYGNRLQNYALQQAIENIGDITVETLNNKSGEELYRKNIVARLKNIARTSINKFRNFKNSDLIKIRNKSFYEFNNEFIKYSDFTVDNEQYDENINKVYDFVICGSDQIWNPSYKENANANFIQFVDKEKRIAYAPSFGVNAVPENRKAEYREYINGISNISVREEGGKKIIEELTGRNDAHVLIDPTMLLNKLQWQSIEKKPINMFEGKYILNYFLGNLSDKRRDKINSIAKKNGWKVINILDKSDPFYTCGPSEFVYLEEHAELICTDSFHSCVFGILMDTPFIVFEREDKTVSMNSRIDTLLGKFGLQDRKYNGSIDDSHLTCDYSKCDIILERERKKSYDFLRNSLNIK